MQRRELSRVLLASAGSAMLARNAEAQTCTAPCYARTLAEVAAGVIPTNLSYSPLYVDRYGTNATPGTTSMRAAFQSAINVMRILGIFSRLTARDKKMRYREFMPRMWGHLARTLQNPALADARAFVEDVARPYLEKAA